MVAFEGAARMRKLMWVLLGLVVFAGALSLGTYRHWWEPQQRVKAQKSAPAASQQSQTRGLQQAPAGTRGAQGGGTSTTTETLSVDTMINVLNIVVGIMGIWMTWVGMRMQRQAMEISNGRNDRR
jgi:hypothetical protein